MSVAAGQTEGDTPRVRRTATSSSVAGGGYAQPETGKRSNLIRVRDRSILLLETEESAVNGR